jgi:parallel beta-helix repeat protein
MQKGLIIKGLVLSVIVLFFGLAVIQSTGISNIEKTTFKQSTGITLYVGGSGPNNYTTIQSAVENASDGDTVFVYNGTYYEFDIFIKKSISLIGENKSTTIIDANIGRGRKAIKIFKGANEVIVSGFTIQNATFLGLDIFSNNNIIKDNIIQNNGDGIRINNNSNTISGNIISNNNVRGVRIFFDAAYNIITNNRIINNGHYAGMEDEFGGVFADMDSLYNIIRRNDIMNNSIGVNLVYCHRTVVKENNFIGNNNSAYFYNSFFNRWDKNYWDDLKLTTFKLIKGQFYFSITYTNITFSFPLLSFDWRPAKEPYDIPDTSSIQGCGIE